MIMSNTEKTQPILPNQQTAQGKKPNEAGKIIVQAHMKIFDPQTKQVYVEGRA